MNMQGPVTKKSRTAISGFFNSEILALDITSKKKTISVKTDEEPMSVDLSRLSSLRPAFDKSGTVTAGNSSSINDGAALLVLCSEEEAKKQSLPVLAKIISTDSYAHEPSWFTTAPVASIQESFTKSKT